MGCAATRTQVIKLSPPAELMLDCEHPVLDVTTNKGLAAAVIDYRSSLNRCNIDKASLRLWVKEP